MDIAIVVAASTNGVIGRNDGSIPWRVKTDVRRFREMTSGWPVIMGRKTFDAFKKPPAEWYKIVLTRDKSFVADGCIVVHNADNAIAAAKQTNSEKIFVIGGGAIYEALMPFVTTIYLTRVHIEVEGDAYFNFDESEWNVVSEEFHPADPETEDDFPFTYILLKRK